MYHKDTGLLFTQHNVDKCVYCFVSQRGRSRSKRLRKPHVHFSRRQNRNKNTANHFSDNVAKFTYLVNINTYKLQTLRNYEETECRKYIKPSPLLFKSRSGRSRVVGRTDKEKNKCKQGFGVDNSKGDNSNTHDSMVG